jgi:hypothetical protein
LKSGDAPLTSEWSILLGVPRSAWDEAMDIDSIEYVMGDRRAPLPYWWEDVRFHDKSASVSIYFKYPESEFRELCDSVQSGRVTFLQIGRVRVALGPEDGRALIGLFPSAK